MDIDKIQGRIHEFRGRIVMFDFDLARLYQISTKALKQAVRRNHERFPEDFMFQLTEEEFTHLRSQFVTSSVHGGTRYLPFAFTEQGIAMLSSVLKSKVAIQVNIGIMRSFVYMRRYALTHQELTARLRELEGKFNTVYEALNYLLARQAQETGQANRNRIGYVRDAER